MVLHENVGAITMASLQHLPSYSCFETRSRQSYHAHVPGARQYYTSL